MVRRNGKFKRSSFVLAWLLASVVPVCGQPRPEDGQRIFISMPEPPEGYVVSTQQIKVNDAFAGYLVTVRKEGANGNVVISIDMASDRSAQSTRAMAAKGYVDGVINSFQRNGFKLIKRVHPDFEQFAYLEPMQVELACQAPDGGQVMIRQFIFFTDIGVLVQVSAVDDRSLDALSAWARNVKPASMSSKPHR